MAANPPAGLFTTETIRTIAVWGVLVQLAQPLLEPIIAQIRQETLHGTEPYALPVAEAVLAVIKGHRTFDDGANEASQYGFTRANFQTMVDSAGEPPGLEFLLTAFRRGLIEQSGTGADATSLEQGIRDSRLKNKWIHLIEQMRVQPITAAEAIAGWVRGQLSEEEALRLAYQGGLNEESARQLFHITGRPPSPTELAELLRREFIPLEGTGPDALSFQQGIFEGDTKDKWWQLFARLAEYIPPPRTVTAMVREGALTDEEALSLFKQNGLSEHLAAAYLAAAHHQKTAATRELAKGDINTLYHDRIVSADEHAAMLRHLGYSAQDAAFEQAVQDFRRTSALLTQAETRIRTLYVQHKISQAEASRGLDELQIPAAQKGQLLRTWTLERQLTIHTLTFGEVVAAHHYKIIETEEAMARLGQLGYGPRDAYILLANREHGPLGVPMPADNTPPP